jgi:hypothetical protein
MLRTRNLTLSGTAQELTINDGINTANTISVQNTDTSAPLYIGNQSVTATEYGIKLAAGQIWSADLKPDDQVYAVGTSIVAVMILEK